MSSFDQLLAILMLLAFSISLLFGLYFMTELQNQEVFKDTIAEAEIAQVRGYIVSFNGWFPILIIGVFAGILVSAYFVDTHPIFLVVSVVVLLFVLVLVNGFVDMFNEVASSAQFAGVVDELPLVVAAWEIMPMILLVFSAITMIILYAKYKRGGSDGSAPVY